MKRSPEEIRTDPLASGVIDLLVLRVVADGQTYGYAIAQSLEVHGLVDVSEATVYTAVKRMEKHGFLTSHRAIADNGRARRYYAITKAGRDEMHRRLATWDAMAKVVASVFADGEGT